MSKLDEQRIQQACVKWFRMQHGDRLLFAVTNNSFGHNISDSRMGAINRSMGVLSGVSDLILCHNSRTYFIEIKTDKGRQNPNQKVFQSRAQLSRFDYHIVRSFDEFMNLINSIIA